MKIWQNYGSEHSANLVMIGRFKEVSDAKKAAETIETIKDYLRTATEDYNEDSDRYSDGMLALLQKLRFHPSPSELQQFQLDIRVEQKSNSLVITTDETEISAFLRLLIDNGAKVKVYSADKYPDEKDED